jgi:hypothetical protein
VILPGGGRKLRGRGSDRAKGSVVGSGGRDGGEVGAGEGVLSDPSDEEGPRETVRAVARVAQWKLSGHGAPVPSRLAKVDLLSQLPEETEEERERQRRRLKTGGRPGSAASAGAQAKDGMCQCGGKGGRPLCYRCIVKQSLADLAPAKPISLPADPQATMESFGRPAERPKTAHGTRLNYKPSPKRRVLVEFQPSPRNNPTAHV